MPPPRFSPRKVSASPRFAISRRTRTFLFPRIYYYLRNKEELLYLISKRAFEQLSSRAEGRTAGVQDAEEKLKLFIQAHIEYQLDNVAEMKVLIREAGSLSGRNATQITRQMREYSNLCRRIIEQVAERHERRDRSRNLAHHDLAAVRRDELGLRMVRAGARSRAA